MDCFNLNKRKTIWFHAPPPLFKKAFLLALLSFFPGTPYILKISILPFYFPFSISEYIIQIYFRIHNLKYEIYILNHSIQNVK